jgi:oxidase EvaA
VQATRSNYQGVHGGSRVPYLEYFTEAARREHRVLCDVRQSEQGTWFLRKRNRNIAIEVDPGLPVPVRPGFVWLPLGELLSLLAVDDLVNMDTRSVLACLPAGADNPRFPATAPAAATAPSLHSTQSLLSWIADVRERTEPQVERVRLVDLDRWRQDEWSISHESGRFFGVIGVRVEAAGREVSRWSQPMIEPSHTGLVAFLLTRIDGVPHVLVQCRTEPGFVDTAELAPSVQCAPETYEILPAELRPRHLDLVRDALAGDRRAVRFDALLSEEGGRFHHARTRHVIVETDQLAEGTGHRWVSESQLTALLRHSHYVNMQARSLLVCLRAMAALGART